MKSRGKAVGNPEAYVVDSIGRWAMILDVEPKRQTKATDGNFCDVHGQYPITPQVLAKRTSEYRAWVEAYARNHKVPVKKHEKGKSMED